VYVFLVFLSCSLSPSSDIAVLLKAYNVEDKGKDKDTAVAGAGVIHGGVSGNNGDIGGGVAKAEEVEEVKGL
jgi:uncharacterized membrane protein YgcG